MRLVGGSVPASPTAGRMPAPWVPPHHLGVLVLHLPTASLPSPHSPCPGALEKWCWSRQKHIGLGLLLQRDGEKLTAQTPARLEWDINYVGSWAEIGLWC